MTAISLRRPALIAALIASTALPALAQTAPGLNPGPGPGPAPGPVTWGEIFSPDMLMQGLATIGLEAARGWVELRYDDMSFDLRGGAINVTGLVVRPLSNANCTISVGRFGMMQQGYGLNALATGRIVASDISVAPACFGDEGAMMAMMLGLPSIAFDHADIGVAMDRPSTAMQITMDLSAPGLARIEGQFIFDSFGIGMPGADGAPNGYDYNTGRYHYADPFVYGMLRRGHVSLTNEGFWEKLQPMLPPDAREPEAFGAMIEESLRWDLSAEPAAEVGRAAAAFAADPRTVTLLMVPETPFDLRRFSEPEDFETGRRMMGLSIGAGVPAPGVALIDRATIEAARAAGADEALRLRVGLAAANGQGMPVDLSLARSLLAGMEANPEAALALARAEEAGDPQTAYILARAAAAAGASPALMNRLENQLGPQEALAAMVSAGAAQGAAADDLTSVSALRAAALAAEDGRGRLRDYRDAYLLASLAAAAGDPVAQQVLIRLDAALASAPDWAGLRDAARAEAASVWAAQDLGAALAQ